MTNNKTADIFRWAARVLTLTVIALVLWWLFFTEKDNHLEVAVDERINATPQQIESIRAIGEWEFLSITDEELVDTIRRGLFSDDHLVRIYYGTLRLGINLHKAPDGWLTARGDSVVALLPPVELLDHDFIDETRTKAFFESGRWTPNDREALYHKARRQMMAHSLTATNLESARLNADAQFRRMLKAMGYQNITIKFQEDGKH